ncbi:MAG: PAS domain S-box protein, partial [Dehalococcoidia bacterium]
LQLAQRVGNEIAGAIANSQIYNERVRAEEALRQSEEEQRRLALENEVVAEIGRIISSSLEIEEVYEHFSGEVSKLIHFDRIVINILDRAATVVTGAHFAGIEVPPRRRGTIQRLAGTSMEEVVRTRAGLLFLPQNESDVVQRFPGLQPAFEAGMRSFMTVALMSKGQVAAMMSLHSATPDAYTEQDLQLAQRVGNEIAGAIANSQLYAERMKAEEELKEAHNLLEQRVRVRTAELSAANAALNAEVGERRRAEDALRWSEERHRRIIETAHDAFVSIDSNGSITDWNAQAEMIFGWPRQEAVGRKLTEILIPTRDQEAHERGLARFLATGEGPLLGQRVEISALHRDGHEFPVEITITPAKAGNGFFFNAFVRDITDRLRAEEALKESEERFRGIFDQSPVGICLIDQECRYVQVNPAFCNMLGYTDSELVGCTIGDVTYTKDVPSNQELVSRVLSGEIPGYQMEKRYVTRDAEVVWAKVSGAAIPDLKGKPLHILAIVEDVTERRLLQEQLIQAQKMEVVGQLAGGVAHDFNNLLTPVLGFADLGMNDLAEGHPVRSHLEVIRGVAERATVLVSQLMAFSRRKTVRLTVFDLNTLVLDTQKLLRPLIGEDIELACMPAPEPATALVDPGQMEQVLINMAVNSRDAMPQGGRLTIKAANVTLPSASANNLPGLAPGNYVILSISDTGVGMDEKTRSRMFEPFFTTKEVGKGTGLGLATCYGIVHQSGGKIRVQSELSRGTTFEIYLPKAKEAVAVKIESSRPKELSRGTETVLLVEDEPAVLRLTANVLARQGYKVLEAANGEEALQVAQEHGEEGIHLLLTDVVMPRMGGKDIADRLRTLHPGIKILFTSGHSDEKVVHVGVLGNGISFMPKPFLTDTLTHKVREMLDSGNRA